MQNRTKTTGWGPAVHGQRGVKWKWREVRLKKDRLRVGSSVGRSRIEEEMDTSDEVWEVAQQETNKR